MGEVRGRVMDASGGVIPGAEITATGPGTSTVHADGDGRYLFQSLVPGKYVLMAHAEGFSALRVEDVLVAAGRTRQLDLTMRISVDAVVTVTAEDDRVALDADHNASRIVLRGKDLNALSDDPSSLAGDLLALAGPAPGPDGGQIYVNGFEGGKLPPKSAIREIRINDDPFSAEFDRVGYGRVQVFTKPGSQKLSGEVGGAFVNSQLSTAIPLTTMQPYHQEYQAWASASGPLAKWASLFTNTWVARNENQAVVVAVDPTNVTNALNLAYSTPFAALYHETHVDAQAGKAQTISVRFSMYLETAQGEAVGGANLPSQAVLHTNPSHGIEITDSIVFSPKGVSDLRFQWGHSRETDTPASTAPTVSVPGAFVSGGNNTRNNANFVTNFELSDGTTITAGKHTLRAGFRLRSANDTLVNLAGTNGSTLYQTTADYLANTPYETSMTIAHQPRAHVDIFDAAVFVQDQWKVRPNLNVGLGLRVQGQNRIHDPVNWAPRVSLAWSAKPKGDRAPSTVFRAGYGFFYNRLFASTQFTQDGSGALYLLQPISNNGTDRVQQVTENGLTSTSISTLDPHFHAALNMQASVGVDRQLGKTTTLSVNYVNTRGVHQYLTNNVTAPGIEGYLSPVVTPPAVYNNQLQSSGIYKQQQLIVTVNGQVKKASLHATYSYSHARSDTQGVMSYLSVPTDPLLDYGHFGVAQQLSVSGNWTVWRGINLAPELIAKSGTPYNITIGNDLTGTNQSNARPTYGTCGAVDVVMTQFGCLDVNPAGKSERIVPFNLGTGPRFFNMNLRVGKDFGVGPKVAAKGEEPEHRRFTLTASAFVANVFNVVNLGAPNGVLSSGIFGQFQTTAVGHDDLTPAGNRFAGFITILKF